MTGLDQRKALSAAERALEALAEGASSRAIKAAAEATALDSVGLFARLRSEVHAAAAEVEQAGAVSAAQWKRLADAVGPGPLAALAERHAAEY